MLVKVCGVTQLEDAEFAVDCGAGAVGFVFWPDSPRFIDPSRAYAIAARLPPFVTPVGVFVNQPAEHVNDVAAFVGLGAVQLHGDETVEYAATLARPVLKAIVLTETSDETIERWPSNAMVLLDAHDPVRRGGTGQTIDWAKAAAVAARRRVVLAGGLTPGNVADAIDRVRPFGIDISSGVESSPGVKDHGKLRALFAAVNGTESSQGSLWTST
jgi:phosphoribosylanthranilate isomerase